MLSEKTIRKLLKTNPPIVENMRDPNKQIQVSGIDLSIESISMIKHAVIKNKTVPFIDFTNENRRPPIYQKISPQMGGYYLSPGAYLVKLHERINLPKNISAIIKPRSTMVRAGCGIQSGLWDAGYCGNGEVLLTIGSGVVGLSVDARICQMTFFKLDANTKGYNGKYQEKKTKKQSTTIHKKTTSR